MTRSTEQLALDTFVQLLEIGATVNPTHMVGRRGPAVQVLVTQRDRHTGVGFGIIEGQTEPISLATVERHVCSAGTETVIFDEYGQPLNLEREQRLYTGAQRRALAARDGGCRFPGCERPPSWAEAHHIRHWKRDRGPTNIENGILLCKHHHLLVHNNGWEITHERGEYWIIPPPSVDAEQRPILMPSRSPVARRLATASRAAVAS
jgi:hypothetical protein